MASSSSDSDENSHTTSKKRNKVWLQTGKVPRSTLQRWKKRNVQCSESLNETSENHDVAGASHLHPNMAFDLEDYFQDECSNLQDGKIEASSVESDSIANEACNRSDRTSQTSGNSDTNDTSQESDEDESSDSDDNSYEDCNLSFLPEPLFSGSKNSVGEAIRLLLDLYSSHALSKQCLKDLVTLLHRLLPIGNNFPRSYYFFKKTIDPFIPPKLLTVHTACDKCGTYVGQKKKGGEKVQCPACTSTELLEFQDLNLSIQIKYLFEKRHLADAIDTYTDDGHSDIKNSEEYARLKTDFPNKYDISLLWNFDGFAPQKSNCHEIWPILFTICEVAPQERSYFTMVAGLWHNKHKPTINAYLIPFTKHLQDLVKNGVTWTHPRTGKSFVSKVIAPVLSVDAPARAMAQNLHYHRGEFSCTICEIKGETLRLGRRSHKQIFPFPEVPDPIRTQESMKNYAAQSIEDNVIVKGVKGPSILDSIPYCDSSKSIVLDYLHLVLLGITRQFFILWFTDSSTDWYVGRLNNLTKFLKNIQRLYETPRCPTDGNKWKLFKAQTWRVWLLFISLPALNGRLKNKYFQHWILFVAGISSLLKENVNDHDLQLAEILLSLFVQDAQVLYGPQVMSHNLHGVLHLVLIVRRWGALWAHSTFKFEGMNGTLSRLLHGTLKLSAELVNTLSFVLASQTLNHLFDPEKRRIKSYPNQLMSPCKPFQLADEERDALQLALGNVDVLKFYYRAYIHSRKCTSELYKNERATNNRTVCFLRESKENYGVVRFYVKKGKEMFALLCRFEIQGERYFKNNEVNITVDHIVPIKVTDALHVVPLHDIVSKVFRVDSYVCRDLNGFEQYL
ncbi:hypothetical protein KUF71_022066 [Frankliniella fusca]|uniref:Transposase domain-containing protein n=1 Tax=Frankliniella fusca TaxID=407009 RepID=A0AAE1H2N7_9NEOP|nr:hypothetical protein KUF71_022066 [Frankliniella fusca]